jgi:hypothetical protein
VDEAQRAELEALRADRAARDKAKKEAEELRELQREKLERALEADTKGLRGEAFEIVDNRFGLFAIRAPEDAEIMRWEKATPQERTDLDWSIQFLRPLIVPPAEGVKWAQVAAMRSALCWETAASFTTLLGASLEIVAKK